MSIVDRPIYLDSHATTPVDPRVLDVMLPYFTEQFGNASSRTHAFGWSARDAVDRARKQVAALIGVSAREVVFTSGATEANNLAIKGVGIGSGRTNPHIVTVVTEHHSVLDPCESVQQHGVRVTRLGVGEDGLVDLDQLDEAIDETTVLVSVMAANNETGVIQPLDAIARLAHARGALVHSDATQAIGKVPFNIVALDLDLVSLTAHKMYGPKGIGALVVRRRSPRLSLTPIIDGGGHEGGLRSGTLNVPGIVGLGKTAELCKELMSSESEQQRRLRDRLLEGLRASIGDLRVNGSLTARLPHNLNVSVPGVDGRELITALDDLAVSNGAACASDSAEPSYVLSAMGIDADTARASLRFGLSRFTTEEEIEYAIQKVASVVAGLRRKAFA